MIFQALFASQHNCESVITISLLLRKFPKKSSLIVSIHKKYYLLKYFKESEEKSLRKKFNCQVRLNIEKTYAFSVLKYLLFHHSIFNITSLKKCISENMPIRLVVPKGNVEIYI